jgi:PRTRC genetic system protein B
MRTYVNVGWSQEFKLSKALLVYGESSFNSYPYRHPFVTMHDVVHAEGEARLAAAQLVTPEMLQTLVAGLGPSAGIEVLPEHILARTAETLVWWTAAAVRRMFFTDRGGDKSLRRLNGKQYPHPPLVFKASENHLWIRALPSNKRPGADTKLCMAPYWNCYDNAVVCTGSMRIPEKKSVAVTADWEHSFFHSAFSHAAGVKKHTRYPKGTLAMWEILQGKKHFPLRYLFPVKQTLEQFVISNDNFYRNEQQDD